VYRQHGCAEEAGPFLFCLSIAALWLLIGPLRPSAHSAAAGTSFTLRFTALNEERSLEVHVPSGRGPFDTVCVLDGQAHFANVVDSLARIGRPERIVVGLGNIWLRNRDYTLTRVALSAFVTPGQRFGRPSGSLSSRSSGFLSLRISRRSVRTVPAGRV
jgi:hypothetical protein